ncbi:hypothetical protein CONPUDRAFT_19142, partial [Coniophora puteana RWD-64-598 SS2]
TPTWLAHSDELRGKHHSSVILTVKTREEADWLTKSKEVVFLFGSLARFAKFHDTKPLCQCTNCWAYDHYASRCKAEARCHTCAGPHHENDHTCAKCPATAEAQKTCTHTAYKCASCGGEHAADSARCATRL